MYRLKTNRPKSQKTWQPKFRKVVLIGFMYSGKSSIGKLLARELNYRFVDMDQEIINICGFNTVSEIFAAKGEEYFREVELDVAQKLELQRDCVISTGGGVVERERTMQPLLAGNTCCVFLRCSIETVLKRHRNSYYKDNRPLFASEEAARELFSRRQGVYRSYANLTLDCDKKSIHSAAIAALGMLESPDPGGDF